jgi:hypothetical protein
MGPRLLLSFWDLCLENMPQERFEQRTLTASEARTLIGEARADQALLCVSREDLFAPNRERVRQRHEALSAVLRTSYDIPLRVDDFVSGVAERDGPRAGSGTPQPACLNPSDRLLVVTCRYSFLQCTEVDGGEDCFLIAQDSVTFELFEPRVSEAGTAP